MSEHDRRRLRQTGRILLAGGVLAVVAAAAAGLAGHPGRTGAVLLLLMAALSCAVAALHALVAAVVDELGDRHVARRRLGVGAGLLLVAGLLMAMVGGAAAG